MTTPVCLWSGPRNVSTALMYGFAQLAGIRVIDEPLYGHYLRVSGAEHPGREDVMKALDCDGDAVMQKLLLQQAKEPGERLFIKHMAHHLLEMDLGFLSSTSNVFLVRDPREMLPSLTIQLPSAGLYDTGLRQQWELFADLSQAGRQPVILDSRELLLNPAVVLRELCRRLDIRFSPDMLSWPPGTRVEDGVWAPHWYHAVHKSTGFAPYEEKTEFPEHLRPLLDDCVPWYEKLYHHALRASATGEST